MRDIDRDQAIRDFAADVFVATRRWSVGFGHPVRDRHRDIEILGLDDVGQFLESAMNVSLTGVPTALGQVDPAAQTDLDARVRLAKWHQFGFGEVLLPALDRDRVIARRQIGFERVRGNRRVFLERLLLPPVRFVVAHRRAFCGGGLCEEPFALASLKINPRSQRLVRPGIDHPANEYGGLRGGQ